MSFYFCKINAKLLVKTLNVLDFPEFLLTKKRNWGIWGDKNIKVKYKAWRKELEKQKATLNTKRRKNVFEPTFPEAVCTRDSPFLDPGLPQIHDLGPPFLLYSTITL